MLGNAKYWPAHARALGYPTGSVPQVGATAVFQPRVQGASAIGHVGHVEEVYDNGWFMISEMNFYWNGGGWGKVDYRYVQMGSGVSFVY
jgi:surface antigen